MEVKGSKSNLNKLKKAGVLTPTGKVKKEYKGSVSFDENGNIQLDGRMNLAKDLKKTKEKKAEEDNKTSTKPKPSTKVDSSKKSNGTSISSSSKNQQKSDSLTEVVRAGMSKFNPYAKEEFDGMGKEQLKEELNYRVHEMMEMNATCVKEGLKTFSSEQQFINESIAEVCQEQNITIDQYNEFMKS